jgi:MOSC domain-containing protein YiiM
LPDTSENAGLLSRSVIGLAVVNVGTPSLLAGARGDQVWSGIRKLPVPESSVLSLSTVGVLERDVRIGDVWSWGDAALQVSQPRWPCFKLALHRGRADIQSRMRFSGRTGWYRRVLQPGAVPVAGPIDLAAEDPRGVTVEDAHLAMSDRHLVAPDLVRAVADHPALAEQWRAPLLDRLDP